MTNKKKVIQIILLFIIICLFFRIDFRFKNTVECCSDDFDYFVHAETIALDYDFDYSNQLTSDHPYKYQNLNNSKIAPVGFPGAGMLASPFYFIGHLVDKSLNKETGEEILNYTLLIYSLSSIFYFFISYFLVYKFLIKLKFEINKYKLLLFISGSGITYFAFERFSMTHVYEMFAISLLIWQCVNFYIEKKQKFAMLIPLTLMLNFIIRMSNLYIFIVPLIVKSIVFKKLKTTEDLVKNIYFVISTLISFVLYCILSLKIYGKVLFNPQEVYGTNITIDNVTNGGNEIFSLMIRSVKDLAIVFFGNEFGIFWVSPIIFLGILIVLKSFNKYLNLLLIICFLQNLAILLIWRSTGASYGYRYLYSLVPLCVLIYYFDKNNKEKSKYTSYLFIMSIFSNLSILFFETTEQTQLSMFEIENSFGEMKNYSEPDYVLGLIKSFTELNSYLIIFTTSLVGVLFFKFLLIFFDSSKIIIFLSSLGLPTENKDFILYLENLNLISINKILLIVLFLFYFCFYVVVKLEKTKVH